MRIYVKGFGCSSNLADTEVLAGCLLNAGHLVVSNLRDADMVLYNTCAVKAPTENRMIDLLKRVPKDKKLVVAGCLPIINFERLRKEVDFDAIVGPACGDKIVGVVKQVSLGVSVESLEDITANMPRLDLPRLRVSRGISIIPIGYGCLGSCSYCCVHFARGKLRSYDIEEIVGKVAKDISEGVREVWLTAQDTACYGKDVGTDLAELIQRVCSVEGDFFVRVGMMTPNNALGILDELVEAFHNEKMFKFLHLPVQSGDDAVLGRMNRFYSVGDFLEIVMKFREAFPRSTLATDIIVGFPGESKEEFKHSLELVENTTPDIVNVSKFFGRPKTPATKLEPKVLPSEIKGRSSQLARLGRSIGLKQNVSWVGWSGKILVDEMGKSKSVVGRNFAYKPVVIRRDDGEDLLGKIMLVRVVDAFPSHLLGEIG